MKFIKLRKYLHVSLILVILVYMWGCGSGEGTTQSAVVDKSASVSVIKLGSGRYVIQGDRLDVVASIGLHLSYNRSGMISSTVTLGELFSGAMMNANTLVPGAINIAIIGVK